MKRITQKQVRQTIVTNQKRRKSNQMMDKKLKKSRDVIYRQLSVIPRNLRFKTFEKMVKKFGYFLDRIKGSHFIYIRISQSRLTFQPDKNGKTKQYQIRQFLKEIESLNLLEKE